MRAHRATLQDTAGLVVPWQTAGARETLARATRQASEAHRDAAVELRPLVQ
jgi:hypothetical protein